LRLDSPPCLARRPVTTEEPEQEPEELSTSGRPVEPEAVVTPAKPEPAPAETVQDVAQIVEAVQAAAAEPARRRGDDVLPRGRTLLLPLSCWSHASALTGVDLLQGLLSEDDIRRLATQRRTQAKAANLGFIDVRVRRLCSCMRAGLSSAAARRSPAPAAQGIKEEVQLIEWPKPVQVRAPSA